MKIQLLLSLTLISLANGFDIPKGSLDLSELENAQKAAAKANKPLVFVIAEKDATPT